MKIADPLIHYDVIGKRYRNHEKGDASAGTPFAWSEARFFQLLVTKSDLLLVPETICRSGSYMFWKLIEF